MNVLGFMILMMCVNFGMIVWLHLRFIHMPGGSVNVRAITGAIDAVRVQMDDHHSEDDNHFIKIRGKLADIIEQIDLLVLRKEGIASFSKVGWPQPPAVKPGA
jgi:hypothetical protein